MNHAPTDCGCGGAKGTGGAARPSAVIGTHDRKTEASQMSSVPNDARASGTVVTDGFRGLNPVDGLFLRADHLDAIQTYARSLTVALATATGPGVVHGLGVTLDQKSGTIDVSPGLAITPHGQPLLLNSSVRIPLIGNLPPRPSPDGFWRVELHPARVTSGSAPVYGSLCNDGCADGAGATIQPWRDEGVEIRFEPQVMPGLDSVRSPQRRNWLASQYFERERKAGGPWLTPAAQNQSVPDLLSDDWDNATPLAAEAGVPLALLQQVGKEASYILDMWAARRLVDGPQASTAWRNRIAMRPWSVFLAQILQFQDELARLIGVGEPDSRVRDRISKEHVLLLNQFIKAAAPLRESATLRSVHVREGKEDFDKKYDVAKLILEETSTTYSEAPASMSTLGFLELPPAGYIPTANPPRDKALEDELRSLLGQPVEFQFRYLRADQIADEVLAAQHRDRIPLDPIGEPAPTVDILVPSEPADKAELRAKAYGWVAFVRGAPAPNPPEDPEPAPVDQVPVWLWYDPNETLISVKKGETDALTSQLQDLIGTLQYPSGDWAYPQGPTAETVVEKVENNGWRIAALVVITMSPDRPLAALRATLFGASLDSGGPPPTYAFTGKEEAIIVVAVTANG